MRADAREQMLVAKHGELFACTRRDGDMEADAGDGLFFRDVRHLSELALRVGGERPAPLSGDDAAVFESVVRASARPFEVERRLVVAGCMYLCVTLGNHSAESVTARLDLALAADFADMFEVRGAVARGKRRPEPAAAAAARVVFAHQGRDGVRRETQVALDPPPALIEVAGPRVEASWDVRLDPGGSLELTLTAAVAPTGCVTAGAARERARREHRQWTEECAQISTGDGRVNAVLEASRRDLHALLMPLGEHAVPAAGIPWYVAAFGRDSLIAAHEALLLTPGLARSTLLALADRRAVERDDWRDAEPGKILHELRLGELAGAGLVPHSPYYGTVDATPLFLMLAAEYLRRTGDLDTIATLLPALDAALAWIDDHGDLDGDGFLEYRRRSPGGLANQGWKDSEDCIVHEDGRLADGPIALAEAQAYAYAAKRGMADVLDALGDPEHAGSLRDEAERLRLAFDRAFWDDELGFYALALDGDKRRVRSVTSNPGHCLFCGILDEPRAHAVAERLMAPDMFSGWGIRTLSSDSPAYDPASYHNGSVWPHDNALIATGLARYGHHDAAARVARAMFDAAWLDRDRRLQELWCGYDRAGDEPPVPYPVACSPQAWAAAAPFQLLSALLDAPDPPAWLGSVEVRPPGYRAAAR